jgi:hypothetical protein
MRATPLLERYWSELHQRDFLSAKHLLDEIERLHWRDDGFGELIALERERLELNGLQRCPLPPAELFDPGHCPDGSLAHAYERVLSYLPQRHHAITPDQPSADD